MGRRRKYTLDLECGNGCLSRRLTTPGTRVTAVDVSSMMIRNAEARDKGARALEVPLHPVIETSRSE